MVNILVLHPCKPWSGKDFRVLVKWQPRVFGSNLSAQASTRSLSCLLGSAQVILCVHILQACLTICRLHSMSYWTHKPVPGEFSSYFLITKRRWFAWDFLGVNPGKYKELPSGVNVVPFTLHWWCYWWAGCPSDQLQDHRGRGQSDLSFSLIGARMGSPHAS